MKDIDKFKELFDSLNIPYEEDFVNLEDEFSDKTIELVNSFGESVCFRFAEGDGRYKGFAASE